ncbi:MAG TPA: lipid biosynthesis B12-binding/radical SAM protein [Syntrophorhabdaceae bacterium]
MSRVFLISTNTMTEPYPVYPLGMAVVASALSSRGHRVKQFDLLVEKGSHEGLGEAVRAFKPDIVGVSLRNIDNVDSFTAEEVWTLDSVRALGETVRKFTGAPVVLGGPAFSIMPEEILAYVGGDYGIVGEGGVLFNSLIGRLERGESTGAILRKGETETAHQGDMVFRPLWDRKLIKYYTKKSGVVGLHTKRGCPYNCIYCTYPAVEGTSCRCREPGSVIEDILQLQKDHHAHSVFFTDSIFNDGEDHYLGIIEEILRREITIEWSAFFQPRGLHGKDLRLLKRSGLCAVEAGTDGASDTALQGLNKPFGFDDVVHFNDACVGENIPCVHYVMFGGPGETRNTLGEGLNNIASLKNCLVLAFSGVRIYPGAALRTLSIEEGVIEEEDSLLKPVFYFSPEVDAAQMNEALENAFGGRRDRIFPPSAFQSKLEVMYRFGHQGFPWQKLISYQKPQAGL